MRNKTPVMVIAFLFSIVLGLSGARAVYAGARPGRIAQAQQNKSTPRKSDRAKTGSSNDCSLLTPAILEKIMGQRVQGNPEAQKAPPMYGGAWGWSCTYDVGLSNHGGVQVEFSVYEEASSAKAKQDFDTYSIAADDSRGKPSIGDSAYWVEPDSSKRALDISKKTLLIFVLKGKVHFSIEMTPANEKQLRDLAAAVAARI